MDDFVTLSMTTSHGTVTLSMDYPVWRKLMAGRPDHLRVVLARLDYFAQLPNPPAHLLHFDSPEELA